MIKIYTDGSCKGNGKQNPIGAYAFVILKDDEIITDGAWAVESTTNNRMEMQAILEAFEALEYYKGLYAWPDEKVTIYTDSAYIINCLEQQWYKTWEQNGWVNSSRQPVKNQDLWTYMIELFEDENISFKKVKGHSGNKWNEYVDELAQAAAKDWTEGNW